MFSFVILLKTALTVALVMFSAIVHEVAHGWAAYALGDPTAKNAGRLTLNPLAHIDPVGSVLLPFLMALARGPIFAYAKPVPYNPCNLRHPGRDDVLVALAGPASNLAQACLGGVLFRLFALLVLPLDPPLAVVNWTIYILATYVYVNLVLCFFNLIPLPPLDGSKIVVPLLHGKALETYYQIEGYALPILFAVLYLVPMVFHVDPLGAYLDFAVNSLYLPLIGA